MKKMMMAHVYIQSREDQTPSKDQAPPVGLWEPNLQGLKYI